MKNADERTLESFGAEWERFNQRQLSDVEARTTFDEYFSIFPWSLISEQAEGFDGGCGSGRWARIMAASVGRLHCIDASERVLAVARARLEDLRNCEFHCASIADMPFADSSMEFGYSLGVIHHVPDAQEALKECARILKPGAPFLVYLYYAFDNRPAWFRAVWIATDLLRRGISRLPQRGKELITGLIALAVYWPLARAARVLQKLGRDVSNMPLAFYRDRSFYTMRTDSLDRFGTPLERRFKRDEIVWMMAEVGFDEIIVGKSPPYWRVVGIKSER